MPMIKSVRVIGTLVAVALALGAGGTRSFGANREGSTLAFLISKADMGFHYGKFEEDCPQGFELTLEESYLASLTPAEREWMLRPENSFEYGNAWKNDYLTGPGGTNVCSNPKSFKDDPRRRPYRGVASKAAFGLNLDGTTDGRATPKTCAHQKFEGLNGEPTVDNQLYRASGCSKLNRGTELTNQQYLERAFLIELRGVHDLKNDNHVEIGVYSTADGEASLKAGDGSDVAYQTFTITNNPRWRASTTARIVDGVLISDPIPVMHLSRAGGFAAGRGNYVSGASGNAFAFSGEFEFRDVRFRLTMQPDGTFTGVMADYRPIDNIYLSEYAGGRGTASIANNDCAAEYNILAKFADGHPDPVTGECTAISAAHNITGIPAFVVPAPGETLSAVRTGSSVAAK
jgi:hypothetical protein